MTADMRQFPNAGQLLIESDVFLGVLRAAAGLIEWEGDSILPEGPEEAIVDYMARHRQAAGPLPLALLQSFRRLYGAGVARTRRQIERYTRAVESFAGHFGRGPLAVGRAPARINILGEHVDYVAYLPTEVLPFASREHDMLILFRPREDVLVRGRSTLAGTPPAEFSLDEGPRPARLAGKALEERWLAWLSAVGTPERNWSNYVKAAVFFRRLRQGALRRGMDFLLDSTIPPAGGASSSSAIVVLSGAAIRAVNDVPFDAAALAQDSAMAEWYIGTRGGNMDHSAMCLSRRQHALHLNFSPFAAELAPLHRYRYRWVTFFAHPADKSGAVLLEYNERSAVSRLLIPAYLQRLLKGDAALRRQWRAAARALESDPRDLAAANAARAVVLLLPEQTTVREVRREFPEIFAELERSYPRLAQAAGARPLLIRARALHHVGEIARVREAVRILKEIFSSRMPEEPEKTEPGLRAVGDLITESHESLRDLYHLTTPDIDELAEIILGHPGVYGARLMGGGFGGNLLALICKEHVAELVNRVQERYFGPRGRDGLAEGSVMVNTPGEGFGFLCLNDVLREAIINASALWWQWERYEPVIEVCRKELLNAPRPRRPIRPIIVAGGLLRREPSGYRQPAMLNQLAGRTSLEHVFNAISGLSLETLPPVVIISPAVKKRDLAGIKFPPGTRLVLQERQLGTGNAVLAALPEIAPEEDSDALVAWASQPLLTTRTLENSILIHQAVEWAAMVFPTAVTRTPYATIHRDLHGYVIDSRETAAEGAPTKRLGETNVGAFVLRVATLRETLAALHRRLWDARRGKYRTLSGELGFPNEMARALVGQRRAVIALPIAAEEESFGLRNRACYERARRVFAARARRRGK